jgi:hypothetical protein
MGWARPGKESREFGIAPGPGGRSESVGDFFIDEKIGPCKTNACKLSTCRRASFDPGVFQILQFLREVKNFALLWTGLG